MPEILVAYDSTEGQTATVAARVAEVARGAGCGTRVVACGAERGKDALECDAVIVAAAIHTGKHGAKASAFVARRRELLERVPSAFISVSLSAADAARRGDAEGYVATFLAQTGWKPAMTATVAGALNYTRYGFVKRFFMKRIAGAGGMPTDTSRDHEFTDWTAVERFTRDFLEWLAAAPRA